MAWDAAHYSCLCICNPVQHGTTEDAISVGLLSGESLTLSQVLARKLPLIEAIILVIHIFAFFGILVTLWVLAPVNTSAKQVFTQFNDGGGWSSLGGSALIGITSGIYPLIGGDAAVHMSEELRDAGKTLPKCMIWTTVVNGGLAWIMAITFCFCVGDLEEALNSPTGLIFFYP